MKRLLFSSLLVGSMVVLGENALAANDPSLVWQTIDTPHFRVTFNSEEREVAEHVATLAENLYENFSPLLGWKPSERTEIYLADQTDAANGSAGARPYNAINLNVTAPEDLSPLGDVDDWYLELVTHEYTHVVHTDHVRGVPAILNAVLGKTLIPNQTLPRWFIEGLATYEESDKTSGGRLRSSVWRMFMRTDVLENNVAPLDVFTNPVRRWPQGSIWYLYGSFFIGWIAETYGHDALRRMVTDQAYQLIPYGVQRMARRATGRTFDELYPAWVAHMRKHYRREADAVRARGLREGRRLTHGGQVGFHPRFIPPSAWNGTRTGQLLYWRDDAHDRPGLYALPIERDARGEPRANDGERQLLIRTGRSNATFLPDGGVIFNSTAFHKNLFAFEDLFHVPAGLESAWGLEGHRVRLTEAFRATEPDVSPNGRNLVFTTNHRGTRYLQVADLDEEQRVANVRPLVKSGRWEQAFTPRWSPDGRKVAYSLWQPGGFRDIRVVDVATGSHLDLMHDRAIDGAPSFSPDGRRLFFHSDRTGISNIYAYDFATRTLKQVTNVLTGAFQPQVSPDGKTLVYVGYTKRGFDLFGMALDESEWLEALEYVDDRPPMPDLPKPRAWRARPYNPLQTLVPRSYSLDSGPGNYGQAITFTVAGSDIANQHAVAGTLTVETDKPEPQVSLSYAYNRLPFDVGFSVYRSISPRGGLRIGEYEPTWTQETVGARSSLTVFRPSPFDNQAFSVAYSFNHVAGEQPFPESELDPYELPAIPNRGMLGALSLSYSYSNAESYGLGISAERGFTFSGNFSLAEPALASDFTGYAVNANFTTYLRMPWLRHHVLALHAGGGMGGGDLPGSIFSVGGFADLPIVDTIRNVLVQGGVALRGYAPVTLAGRYYGLLNAEYRFPIVNVDRGPSTLPIFFNRLTGNLFVDYGSAFDIAEMAKFKTGVGGELWFDATLGYIVGFQFRLGYARGLASEGIDKLYFLAAVPF